MKPREQHATDRHWYTPVHYIIIAIVMLLSLIAFLYLQSGHATPPALADYCPTINWTSRKCATYLSDHLEQELRGPREKVKYFYVTYEALDKKRKYGGDGVLSAPSRAEALKKAKRAEFV